MIEWLAVKTFLKKAWVVVKHYWYVPVVIIYTLALWFVFNKKEAAFKILEARAESFDKQIKAIDDIHAEEVEAKNNITKKYTETIELIEERYVKTKEELTEKKKKRVKEIVKKHHSNEISLAFLLGQEFGIEYIPSPDEDKE
tara:strand:+ start:193 stop:618 length:426 start_codon:yes stop_codon:yes gene_type:complete